MRVLFIYDSETEGRLVWYGASDDKQFTPSLDDQISVNGMITHHCSTLESGSDRYGDITNFHRAKGYDYSGPQLFLIAVKRYAPGYQNVEYHLTPTIHKMPYKASSIESIERLAVGLLQIVDNAAKNG